jgi:fused signal recognition particle receptor
MSFVNRLKSGLMRTHQGLVGQMERLLASRPVVDQSLTDDLLEIMVAGDMGVQTARDILAVAGEKLGRRRAAPEEFLAAVKEAIGGILAAAEGRLTVGPEKPWVVMFAGVNGAGKTTTIAKLGHRWIQEGRRVSFAAADTFRAGAVEQLRIWSERIGAGFYSGKLGADPGSVAFDAVSAASARGDDILLIDTAGRLHTSVNLMEELKKVRRTCGKALAGSPHEIVLIVDAATGQNAVRQAKMFHEALSVTGVALTKLDGTSKGGIIVAVARELALPIKLVGVGEQEDDLQDFRADAFVDALFAR